MEDAQPDPNGGGRPSLDGQHLAVSLTVNDLPTSVAWYRDALGFAVDREHEREGRLVAASVRSGDVRILLGQDDGAKGENRRKGDGFSMQITTLADIDALADRVTGAGSTLDTEPTATPWGVRMFRVRDPDGFRWTIASPPAGRPE